MRRGDGWLNRKLLYAPYGVDVVDDDPHALHVQQTGDAGPELAETEDQGGTTVQDVPALP
jgi:hypothetical protein